MRCAAGSVFSGLQTPAQGEAHHQEIDREGDQKNAQRRIEFRNARPQPDFEQHEFVHKVDEVGRQEPHGTAGRPMLTMLLHGGVGELSAVVTRYFGGIKLGTGGLVRAYQGMVKLGLETLPTREHMIPARVEVVLDYPHITVFRRLLPDYRATVASENFGVDATYELLLPDQNIPALETALTELTDGAVLITRLDDGTMPPETP